MVQPTAMWVSKIWDTFSVCIWTENDIQNITQYNKLHNEYQQTYLSALCIKYKPESLRWNSFAVYCVPFDLIMIIYANV